MRLNRYLAKAGVASRRGADLLVEEGRVAVNGQVVARLGTVVNEQNDEVTVDGRRIYLPKRYTYLVLNKPPGYLVTCKDRLKRPTVMELVGHYKRLVRPVGRLDLDSSGLLLLTNDGELAFRLSHPRYKVRKTYSVKCRGFVSDQSIRRLERGVLLEDGKTAPAEVKLIGRTKASSHLQITIHEGRKRQIKRMCLLVGCPVVSLQRISFGTLSLGDLKEGRFRRLNEQEVAHLKALAGLENQ